jgi:hypothetical protein
MDGGHGGLAELLLDPAREPRPLLFSPGKLGIIWSAKSACTTVLFWYLWHCDLLQAARFYSAWPHQFRNRVLYSSDTYRLWAGQAEAGGWSWLRIVRDPFKRAVSSYRHALRHGYEDAKMARILGRPIDCELGFSFELFLDYLLKIDIATCNLHHRVQYHPIEKLVGPTEVINIEKQDLTARLRQVDATLETPKEPAEALSHAIAEIAEFHHGRHTAANREHAATSFTKQATWGEWPAHASFLNNSTRQKIATVYAADFTRYADHF